MNNYTYIPLNEPDEIRVFVLQPSENRTDPLRGTMEKMRLSAYDFVPIDSNLPKRDYEVNTYDALSYTWGGQGKRFQIQIGNRILPIGESLMTALSMLRDATRARTIWVDAICINQADVKERNHQVHIMQRIYSRAASVVVWLGPGSEPSRSAIDLIIERRRRVPHGTRTPLLDCKEDALRGLRDIFLRNWWKRIWIVQEVVAARELVIFCGHHVVPWHFFRKVCAEIRSDEFSSDGRSHLLRSSGYRNFTALDAFRRERGKMSLTKYLQCTKDYDASDMRDKLYALIGVASDISPEDIVPDYTKSTKRVFLDLVRFLVTEHLCLDIISSGRLLRPASITPSGSESKPGSSNPSWLPDWGVSQDLRPLDSEGVDGAFYKAGGNKNAVVRMDAFPIALEVEGIVVDKIDFFGGAITSSAQTSLPTLRRWQYIAGQHLASENNFGAVTPPDFWKTIVAGKKYPTAWKTGTASLEQPNFQEQSSFLGQPHILGQPQSLEDGVQSFIAGDVSQEPWLKSYLSGAVTRAVMGRRFFITAKKRMGLGVPEIQLKDRVVVLKGCSVPLVLRAVGDHMLIVGEAYVSGIMDGEVIGGLARGQYKTRMIRLQ